LRDDGLDNAEVMSLGLVLGKGIEVEGGWGTDDGVSCCAWSLHDQAGINRT